MTSLHSPLSVRCPKCGSILQPDNRGRVFCEMCGAEYFVCLECLRSGRKDYESFVFSSVKALAGHMRSHKRERVRRIAELYERLVETSLGGLDGGEAAKLLGEVVRAWEHGSEQLLVALCAAQLAVLSRLLWELRELRRSALLTRAAPPPPVSQASSSRTAGAQLPSFVEGNPWLEVIAGRGG